MRAELRRFDEPGQISTKAGLAFYDKSIVEPCRGDEGSCEDSLGGERAWVIEGIVQCDKLGVGMTSVP